MTTNQKSELEKRLRKNIQLARQTAERTKKYEVRLRNEGRLAAYEMCLFYLLEAKD